MRFLTIFAFVLMCVGVVGCETTAPPSSHTADLTFDHLSEINLDVASIEIRNMYQPPLASPHVEHLLPDPTFDALVRLLEQKVMARGQSKKLVLTINRASMVEEDVETMGGIKGFLTIEPDEKYQGVVDVKIELMSPTDQRVGVGFVNASHTIFVKEGISLRKRQDRWVGLNAKILDAFYAELRNNLWQKFPGLVL